jgi:hypothetical protein
MVTEPLQGIGETNRYSQPDAQRDLIDRLVTQHSPQHGNADAADPRAQLEERTAGDTSGDATSSDDDPRNEEFFNFVRQGDDGDGELFFASDLLATAPPHVPPQHPSQSLGAEGRTEQHAASLEEAGSAPPGESGQSKKQRSEAQQGSDRRGAARAAARAPPSRIPRHQQAYKRSVSFEGDHPGARTSSPARGTRGDSHSPTRSPRSRRRPLHPHQFSTAGAAATSGGDVKTRNQDALREELSKEHTYTPKINDYARYSSKPRLPIRERLANMAAEREAKLVERERRKQEEDAQQYQENCTFKPNLIARQPRGTHGRISGDEGFSSRASAGQFDGMNARREGGKDTATRGRQAKAAANRLFDDATERETLRATVAGAVQDAELRACTFQPSINPNSDTILEATGYRPIHERIGDIQRETQHNIHAMRVSQELGDPELTFQPRMNDNSRNLVRYSRMADVEAGGTFNDTGDFATDVGTRLSREASAIAERRIQQVEDHERSLSERHSFRPDVSKGTKKIASEIPALQASFLDRQKMWKAEAAMEEKKRRQRVAAEEKQLFRPNIDQSQSAVRASDASDKEKLKDRVKRLSVVDQRRIEERKRQLESDHYSQFSYKPNINNVSRAIGRPSKPKELVHNPRGQVARDRAKAAAEKRVAAECTFQPKTNPFLDPERPTFGGASAAPSSREAGMVAAGVYIPPPPPSFTDPDARMDAIRRKQEEQEAWRQQVIAEREIQELQECTFAPKLHTTGGGGSSSSNRRPTVRQPTGPVVVRGLGRYLEVREMARRKEAEKAELEAKAFKANPKSSGKGGSGITQPKPFKLSKARDPNLKERLAEEAKQRELAQCTFKPTTNESDSRAVIEQVRQYCKTPPTHKKENLTHDTRFLLRLLTTLHFTDTG